MAKKKLTKKEKAERTARKSAAMQASWVRRRREGKVKVFNHAKARTIPNALVDEGRAEWKEADPLEVQLKDAHGTIDRLRAKMNQYSAFREVMTSLKHSMQGMITIINSANIIIDND